MLTKRIRQHFEACGIETQIKMKGRRNATVAGFHSLRHTYVSLHAEAGTPQAIVRDLVGHGNVAMTEHYEHLSDYAVIQHAQSMPALMGDQSGGRISDKEKIKTAVNGLKTMTKDDWGNIRDELQETLTRNLFFLPFSCNGISLKSHCTGDRLLAV